MSFLAKVREMKESAINVAMNYTDAEQKVRAATNGEEPWGPHGSIMTEIAAMTFQYDEFPEVMGMLWKRMLKDKEGKHWRRIYKSMLLLDHLIKNGSDRVIESARDHLYDLRRFENFEFIDVKGKDQGVNVKQKSKDLHALLSDDELLREQRTKCKANRDKYVGLGNPEYNGARSTSPGKGDPKRRAFEDDWSSQTQKTGGRKPYSDDSSNRNDSGGGNYNSGGHVAEDPWNSPASAASNDDDDFAPRGNSQPSQPAADPFGAPAAAVAPPATTSGLFDLLGSPQPAKQPADDWGAFAQVGSTPAAAPAAASDFGSFAAAAPAAAPSNDFGAFASVPAAAPAASNDFGAFASVPAAAPSSDFGAFTSVPAAQATQPMPAANLMGGGLMAPAATQPAMGGGMGDLLGGDLLGGSSTAAPAKPAQSSALPTSNNTWSGLDIKLDGLGLGKKDDKAGSGVFDAPTRTGSQPSVFGGSLSGAGGQGGGGMGGGMGMGMQQNQQPMGGMGMGMGMGMPPQQQQMGMGIGMQQNQQPMGGMGMGMGMGMQQNQPMGGMGMGMGTAQMGMGMGMQQNQQPMGGMGMGMGMSPQQQQMSMGMGMQGNQMNMMGGQQNQQFRR